MLLTDLQSSLIAWTAGIIVFGAAALAGVAMIRRGSRLAVPIILVGILAGLAAANLPWTNGTPVLVVTPGDGKAMRRDLALYGKASYRFADGSSAQVHWKSARQLVVNDTPVPLTIAKVRYGTTWAEPNETRVDPYGAVNLDGRIDHFGPGDLPPATSGKWERYWVRW